MKHGLSFSLRDELKASAVAPIAVWMRTDQLLKMWSAFAALDRGTGTLDDIGTCIEAANLVSKLVDLQQLRDPEGVLAGAGKEFQAVVQAGAPYRMPPGCACERVLRDYGEALTVLPARILIRCIRRTEVDMRRAHAGLLPDALVIDACA